MSGASMEDDPVVQEIDVFLSHELEDHLALFQFPLRPSHLPYDLSKGSKARVKQTMRGPKFEIAYKVNKESENFDQARQEEPELVYYDSNNVTLSSEPVTARGNLALGVLRGSELHLTPIGLGAHQLRPTFPHVDTLDGERKEAKKKAEEAALPGSQLLESSLEEKKEEKKLMQVQIRRRETDRLKQARVSSFAYFEAFEQKSLWNEMEYKGLGDPDVDEEYGHLFCKSERNVALMTNPVQYLESLCPVRSSSGKEESTIPTSISDSPFYVPPGQEPGIACHMGAKTVVARSDLRHMRPQEKIEAVMKQLHVCSFQRLVSILEETGTVIFKSQVDEEKEEGGGTVGFAPDEILDWVQKFSVLVQGVWVVRSDLVKSNPVEITVRDRILSTFGESRRIHRDEVNALPWLGQPGTAKLLSEVMSTGDIQTLLEEVAEKDESRYWEFKVSTDNFFIRAFPNVVKSNAAWWKQRVTELNTAKPEELRQIASSLAPSLFVESGREGMEVEGRGEGEGEEGSEKKEESGGEVNVAAISSARKLLREIIREYLNEMGTASSSILRDLFLDQKEKNEQLAHATDDSFRAVLSEEAVSLHGVYCLKSVEDSDIDPYRDIIISLFRARMSLRKSDVNAAVKRVMGEEIPTDIYIRVMKSLAVQRAGSWTFKGN